MTIEMVTGKIHRATVTDANLNYVGSITIDTELVEKANMRVGQKVDIVNVNNGARFSTYIIPGEAGKRDMCVNGAAARLVEPGDKIIVIAYGSMTPMEADELVPAVLIMDENNNIEKEITDLSGK